MAKELLKPERDAAKARSEKSADAFEAGIGGVKQKLATKLKENEQIIAMVLDVPKEKLDNKTIAQMANDWIEHETFTVDGRTFTRDTIKDSLKTKAKTLGPFAKQVGEKLGINLDSPGEIDKALDKMLPRSETFAIPAKRLSEEVGTYEKENSGAGGFLKNIFSWLGAVLSWVFSGFKDEKKPGWPTDYAYKKAGNDIAQRVGNKLEQDRAENPALAAVLSSDDIADIKNKANEGVVNAARGGNKPAAVTVDGMAAELASVKPNVVTTGDMMVNPKQVKQWGAQFIEGKLDAFLKTPLNDNDPENIWTKAAKEIKEDKDTGRIKAFFVTPARVKATVEEQLAPKKAAIAKTAVDGLWEGAMNVTDEQLNDKTKLANHLSAAALNALNKDPKWKEGIDPPKLAEKVTGEMQAQVTKLMDENYELVSKNKDMLKQMIAGLRDPQRAVAQKLGEAERQGTPTLPVASVSQNPEGGYVPDPARTAPPTSPEQNVRA